MAGAHLRRQLRELARFPSQAFFAALSLAVGLIASLTLLAVVRATLYAAPDLPSASDLFHVYGWQQRQSQFLQISFPDFRDLQSGVSNAAELATFTRFPVILQIETEQLLVPAEGVSNNYFRTLRVSPVLGDLYSHPVPPTNSPGVVLSYSLWKTRFGRALSALGSPIEINGASATVIGITPPTFQGTVLDWSDPPQLWIDVEHAPNIPWLSDVLSDRGGRVFLLAGRIQPSSSFSSVDNVLRSASQRLAVDYPPNRETSVRLFRMSESRFWPAQRPKILRVIVLLGAGSGALLLLGIVNAAALAWARCLVEARSYVVRVALGASRASIFHLVWLQSLILTLPGVLAGFVAVPIAQAALTSLGTPFGIPISFHIHIEWRLVAMAIVGAIVVAASVAALPVWDLSRGELVFLLRSRATTTTGTRKWLRFGILALQASLSMVLLGAAGLALFTAHRVESTPLGFESSQLSVVRFEMPERPTAAAYAREAIQGLLTGLMGEPGVHSVALCRLPPLDRTHMAARVAADESPTPPTVVVNQNFIGPGYFKTLGVPLLLGEEFLPGPRTEQLPPVILNAPLAKKLFGATNPLNRLVSLSPVASPGQSTRFQVVGVAPEMKYSSLNASSELYLYRPLELAEGLDAAIVVHSALSTANVDSTVQALWKNRPGIPALIDVTSMALRRDSLIAPERTIAFASAFFGLAAAIVAAAGTFSTASRFVTENLKNLGIRLALGASRQSVTLLVLSNTLRAAAAGVFPAALFLAILRPQTTEWLGSAAPYFLVIGSSAAAQLLLTMLSGLVPALLGGRLDPLELLRHE